MRRIMAVLLSLAVVVAAGCSKGDGSAGTINQLTPGSTVYIIGWDLDGKPGDQALVESKPNMGIWVVPANARFSRKPQGEYTYAITFIKDAGHKVTLKAGQKVGIDHDNCLAADGSEMQIAGGVVDEKGAPVSTAPTSPYMEQSAPADKSNNACYQAADPR